jgi:hypothetical protein
MKTKNLVSTFFVLLSLAACGAGATGAPPAAVATPGPAALDGAAYDVTLDFPGESATKDTLSFSSGRFESSACTSVGFPKWTDYQARTDAGGVSFDVTTHHPEGSTMEWHGTVRGDAVEGTASRTIKGKTSPGTFRGNAHK